MTISEYKPDPFSWLLWVYKCTTNIQQTYYLYACTELYESVEQGSINLHLTTLSMYECDRLKTRVRIETAYKYLTAGNANENTINF
jgi:hypothetical protein